MCGHTIKQLCVPDGRRVAVMQLAHDANHLAGKKTLQRIRSSFYWPDMKRQVYQYCGSCRACQLHAMARKTDRVPISPIMRPTLPFMMCHMDCIGPIEPASSKQHRYALCVIDDCTRWPSVFLLRNLTAKAICDSLMELFMTVGLPEVIVSDRGSNFCSQLTKEFLSRLGVAPRFNSPLHPQASGVIERFNGTFKQMLHFAMRDYGRQWHLVVPYLVWSLREVPNSTTGYSPHLLLFGRMPRGPLCILKESWEGHQHVVRSKLGVTVERYLEDLKSRLETTAEFADKHAAIAQAHYSKHYNKSAADKKFQVGEQVVVLDKDSTHKTFARWQLGTIARVRSPYSYNVEMADGSTRHLHANKIRKFIARVQGVGVVNEQDEDFGPIDCVTTADPARDTLLPSQCINIEQLEHLSPEQRTRLLAVLDDFADCFTETPGHCTLVAHEIRVSDNFQPKASRAYRVPEVLKEEIERQVAQLLELDFIQPSRSPMSSGVVCVVKPDKSIRLACDYRYLNAHTIGDAFPMQHLTDVMYRVGRARWITICDARSGYWQLDVKESHRWLTAFATHHGLWEWKRMPFGLKCAGNTFVRNVQEILRPIRQFSDSYIDDLAVFSDEFDEHLFHFRKFLCEIRASALTLNLKKCHFAQREVVYVGHLIGGGRHRPDPNKIKVVVEMQRPITKRQLKQRLGLLSYYRDYVPNYAAIAKPLTALTGKREPSVLNWGEREQQAFETLRQLVCEAPVLATPTPGQPFRLHTDASAISVGCQLSQCDDTGQEHPIAFASQKLTPTQCAWATIEREAYAVIWALSRFRDIVFGSHITIFVDHNPLKYLTERAPKSAKLTRWALALQEYDVTFEYTKGTNNVVADCLSRLEPE